jgi:hypothetical protein
VSDKRPDFAAEARGVPMYRGDVAQLAGRMFERGRESMREERDAERCTQCDCFEVFIARLTKQRDEAVGLLTRCLTIAIGGTDEEARVAVDVKGEVRAFLAGPGKP